MDYYVKELANKQATLVAVDGYELGVFRNVDAAVEACELGCMVKPLYIEQHHCYLQAGPNEADASFLPAPQCREHKQRIFLGRP